VGQARPRLTLLSQEQKHQVHEWSLRILAYPGVRVDSPRAVRILAGALGEQPDSNRIRIPPEWVSWALSVAPESVAIHNRLGTPAFSLGRQAEGGVRFGIGVTNLYYQDPHSDLVVPFTREHMALSARLGHGLPAYDVVSTIGVLQDAPPDAAELVAALEMVANTTKPLVLLVSEGEELAHVLDLLEHLVGLPDLRPFAIPYVNPITPLRIDSGAFLRLETAIRRGLPVIYSNYGMAGATSPMTAAGTLALLNAELLAGLVLSQLIRPGTPVILGSMPASFDMRAMLSYYGPQTMLLNLACAEMMEHYGLPHCGTSGSGAGWGPDLLASDVLWMNHLTSSLGCAGLAPFVGGNFESLAFSPATVVYGADVIRQARAFASGFRLEEDLLGFGEIVQASSGGSFLGTELTRTYFRSADPVGFAGQRLGVEAWQQAGSPSADRLLRARTVDLIHSLEPPADHDALLSEGEAWIRQSVDSTRSRE
jgi:trimethylamine--corrinoid protein Co-methyltransferase